MRRARRPGTMPNVLLLCEYPTISGGERSMLTTLDGIRAAGIEAAVIAPPAGPLAEDVALIRNPGVTDGVTSGGWNASEWTEAAPTAHQLGSHTP